MIYKFWTSDRAEALRIMRLHDTMDAFREFYSYLRAKVKHDDQAGPETQAIYEELIKICNEFEIDPLTD
jgi:hypothetical protein